MNKLMIGIVSAAALYAAACGSAKDPGDPAPETQTTPEKAEEYGTLSLALTGADDQGTQYRLRNASFQVSPYYYYYPYPYPPYPGWGGATGADGGSTDLFLSTETDPDAPFLIAKLVPGQYYVTLSNDDWYLEELTPDGPVQIEQSVLLSERTQYAYIYDRGETPVSFLFGANGTEIDFRAGALKIGIEIQRPTVCGDGNIEGTEQCDGDNLQGQTCQSASYGSYTGGTLKCNSVCGLDFSGCTFSWPPFDGGGTGGAPSFDAGSSGDGG